MSDSTLRVLHVVRRYGPVGGMERYVWEVTRELAALGHQVEVVCERCHAERPRGIAVHELGEIAPKPRWLSLLRFGARAARWLERNPRPGFVIHSDERLGFHDITTFHGPPFATVRDKPWWKKLSLRVVMQLWLERRELAMACLIVPNSMLIKRQLADFYPGYAHKLTEPIVPGVAAQPPCDWRPAPADGGIIGFIGKEWQRKGLSLAVEIVKCLRRERPSMELWVAGPEPQEVQHLFSGWQGGHRLLGWRSDMTYLREIDVLLHPAKAEPYGMVISEAMATCVPVVVSDRCGAAAQVGAGSGRILPLSEPVEVWAAAVELELQRGSAPPRFERGWDSVAREHVEIYRKLKQG